MHCFIARQGPPLSMDREADTTENITFLQCIVGGNYSYMMLFLVQFKKNLSDHNSSLSTDYLKQDSSPDIKYPLGGSEVKWRRQKCETWYDKQSLLIAFRDVTFNEKVVRTSCIVFQEIRLLLHRDSLGPFTTDLKQKDVGDALFVTFISFYFTR